MNKPSTSAGQPFIVIGLIIILTGVSFGLGFVVRGLSYPDSLSKYPILIEVHELLQTNAYFPLPDNQALDYGLVKGLLQSYNDPYTVFVEPAQHEIQTNQLEGRFGGIGIEITRDTNNLVFIFPHQDSPAHKAGIGDGDQLVQVDQLYIREQTTDDEILAAIRGPVGTSVLLGVLRNQLNSPLTFTIQREEVSLPSVSAFFAPGYTEIGVVKVHIISESTPDEVSKAIDDLIDRGATKLILDIRNNGGGLVDAGINVASLFLSKGQMIIEQEYKGKDPSLTTAKSDGKFQGIPLVVFINQNTASAAEIIAGALKTNRRATIIGVPSFGKDTIQLVFPLSDGSSLHVTAAKWRVPGLVPEIGIGGVLPDIHIITDQNEDAIYLQAAVRAFADAPQ